MPIDDELLMEIEECLDDVDAKWTTWELEFIESLYDQVTLGRPLSDKQRDVLDTLRDKTKRM